MIPNNSTEYSYTNNSTECPYIELHMESNGVWICTLVVFSIMIIASLVGNAMVCKAVFEITFHPRPFSYYLVASLAVAEIVSSICQPFIMTYQETFHWMFGKFACSIVEPLQIMAMFVVTSCLAVIAVHRYWLFVKPEKSNLSGLKMSFIIGSLWVMAFAISLPLFITQSVVPAENGFHCFPIFPGENGKTNFQYYSIARFMLNFAIPCLVLVISYVSVALKLRQHIKGRMELARVSLSATGTTVEERQNLQGDGREEPQEYQQLQQPGVAQMTSGAGHRKRKSKSCRELENDLLRMMYMIIIIFVVCYIPYQVKFLWEYVIDASVCWRFQSQYLVRKYFFMLTCLPSALHPLCYGTMNTFFAKAFSKIIMCRR